MSVVAAALFAQLVVVGGDPTACQANQANQAAEERPVGASTVRELLELMSRNDCVRFLVPAHLLDRRVELAASQAAVKDWRGTARRALAALGISLHDERVLRADGPPAPAPPPPLSDAEMDRGIRCAAPGHCAVERALFDRLLADSASLASAARFVPTIRDGKPDGFKLFAMRPGSFWSRLGFQNGDLVQTINGMDLTTPDRALEAYTRLRDTSQMAVRIVRRGQPQTLQFDIR